MKTYMTYGGINAIVSALFTLAMFFLGFQTDKMAAGQNIQWVGLIFFIVVLFLGMKETRENRPDKAITYGGALLAALMISVFSGLFSTVYTYVHFSFVNPDFPQYVADFTRAQMESQGVPSAQIDGAISIQSKMLHPAVQAIMGVIFAPIMGTLCGLILAIFIKKAPKEDTFTSPPVLEENKQA